MTPIVVRSEKGYQTAISIRNHKVMADELIQDGGTDTAPTPMEIFVGTMGACVAVTTRAYAERKGWPLEGISVELDMKRFKREDYPAYAGEAPYIHEVSEQICFEGALTEEQKERLMSVARKCPIRLVVENPVFFVEQPPEDKVPR
jgi:putative redox protein